MVQSSVTGRPRKLGLLGGTFEDGSWSLYVVPDPRDVPPHQHDSAHPVYGSYFICLCDPSMTLFVVKIPEPLVRIELEDACCLTFDWANSEVIAIGTMNGVFIAQNILF